VEIEATFVKDTNMRKPKRIKRDGRQRIERREMITEREKEARVRVKAVIP